MDFNLPALFKHIFCNKKEENHNLDKGSEQYPNGYPSGGCNGMSKDCDSAQHCQHQFGRYKFVKGGGREAICKLCGYVKHIDPKPQS